MHLSILLAVRGHGGRDLVEWEHGPPHFWRCEELNGEMGREREREKGMRAEDGRKKDEVRERRECLGWSGSNTAHGTLNCVLTRLVSFFFSFPKSESTKLQYKVHKTTKCSPNHKLVHFPTHSLMIVSCYSTSSPPFPRVHVPVLLFLCTVLSFNRL